MKIAVIFDNFGPYHIARLSAVAKRCDLLAVEVSAHSAEYAWNRTEDVRFRRITLMENRDRSKSNAIKLIRRLEATLSGFRPNAVAVPGWSGLHAFSALSWARRRNIPVVVMSESQEIDFVRTPVWEWIKRRYLSNCQAALVGGTPHRAYLEILGMGSSAIKTGYDVVDNDYFAVEAEKARQNAKTLRSKFNLPQNYFLASARFIRKKNLTSLIRAFSDFCLSAHDEVIKSYEQMHLILLGDGDLRPELEALIDTLRLNGRVHLPGFKQYAELPVYYGLAQAFILPSTTEQWGLVVNEAMASGLPVIVSRRCGCAADLVREGENGFTFNPFDEETLTALMLKMASGECNRTKMGEAGRDLIRCWGPERFADEFLLAVEHALRTSPQKTGLVDRTLLRVLSW
ncbi:MAG: glycosyltransferase family 4 protein [Gammaproteobacteria bacterium]